MKKTAMSLLVFLVGLAFVKCSSQKEETTLLVDSVTTTTVTYDTVYSESEDVSYIGKLYTFPVKQEFYTHLYFKEGFDGSHYEEIIAKSDSTIANFEYDRRLRIPLNDAERYFDLSGFATIDIYDSHHYKIGKGRFKRVEYYGSEIGSEFIAVFEPERVVNGDASYCIGNDKMQTVKDFSISEYEMPSPIDTHLMESVAVDPEVVRSIHHYLIKPSQWVLSAYSADTTIYFFEAGDTPEPRRIYTSQQKETLHEIIPLPKIVHERPVLLVSFAEPDSDIFWEAVLVFDGKHYRHLERSRIETTL